MTWFHDLTGFDESATAVRDNLDIDGDSLVSAVNGRRMEVGVLTTPSLGELRKEMASAAVEDVRLRVSEVVADVQRLHCDPANAGALFQVASQFNLLEMTSPSVTPEAGVSVYEYDHTQGPACAIACGAGTIFRNWFVDVDGDGRLGQYIDHQLDMLADVGEALGNTDGRLWTMQNGYAMATGEGIADLPAVHDDLRIGLLTDTEVTLAGSGGHLVTQAYCSALPVAYTSAATAEQLEPLARMILNSAYAATMHAARAQLQLGGSPLVFLTLLGGGVFGNELAWILDAMQSAFDEHRDVAIDVRIVSHGRSNPALARLLTV